MGRGPLGPFLSCLFSMYLIQTLSAGRRLGLRGVGAPWSLTSSFQVLPLAPSEATEHLSCQPSSCPGPLQRGIGFVFPCNRGWCCRAGLESRASLLPETSSGERASTLCAPRERLRSRWWSGYPPHPREWWDERCCWRQCCNKQTIRAAYINCAPSLNLHLSQQEN